MLKSGNVTAVIPTYNSSELVVERVAELQQLGIKNVMICDDASTDDTVSALTQRYMDTIEVVAGTENLGPGGNRNRCIPFITEPDDGLLLSIDADCRLLYKGDLPALVSGSFSESDIGVVGFSIVDSNREPMKWNYGALMHPVHEAADTVLEAILSYGQITQEQFKQEAPERAASFRMFAEPDAKVVGWVAEACFAIRATLFKQLGGFATSMRYHETHDLNARVAEAGYKTIFNPETVVQHLAFDSRFERRREDERLGRLYYYQKHWGMSETVFKRLFDELL